MAYWVRQVRAVQCAVDSHAHSAVANYVENFNKTHQLS